jgi:hypothetical protein
MKTEIMFQNKINSLFFIVAVIYIGLAVVGGARAYSPVPFWDMWNGYLEFFTKVSDGQWSAWWAQHNEHRIVLARIFFWLDLTHFGGQGWFLLIVNYVILMLACSLFYIIWKEVESDKEKVWISYFLITWLFLWIQNENLQWGFQSQFILAQLLPLTSFYLFHLSCFEGRKDSRFFALSIFFAILSIGSMANGILALPLMLVFAVILKIEWRKILLIGLLSTIIVGLYFYEYKAPGGHGSLRQAILANPIGLLQYVAVYVGGPFSFGSKSTGLWTATAAGIFLVFSSMYFAWRVLSSNQKDSLQLTLLIFILFVGGSALGTGGGRLVFGVDQALSSRYMTPSLMAWAALFILYYLNSLTIRVWTNKKLWVFLLAILVLMLPQQLMALKSKTEMLYERNMAGLALELGIKDQAQIGHVFVSADWTLEIAEKPVQNNYSIFGMEPYKDLRQKVGTALNEEGLEVKECKGFLDSVEPVDNDNKFVKVRGWLWSEGEMGKHDLIKINDVNNKIVGYGLTGQHRSDVAQKINKNAVEAGFEAYLLADRQGEMLVVKSSKFNCQLTVSIPTLIFKIIKNKNFEIKPTISLVAVQAGNEWIGQDFQKTDLEQMNVFGSFINSDADVGSITLKMKRGDRLYYRTGPVSTRQTIEILESNIKPVKLPTSTEWQLFEFLGADLPDVFLAKFTDAGNSWGEWSAIAVKNSKN